MMALSNKRKNNHKQSLEKMTVPKKSKSTAIGEINFKQIYSAEELGSVLMDMQLKEMMTHIVQADNQLEAHITQVC